MKEIDGVLTAEQIKRLKEVSLQLRGFASFGDEEVVDSLHLSDKQKDQLNALNENLTKEISKLVASRDGEGTAKKFVTLQKQTLQGAIALLNDDQKEIWKGLTGAPFKLTPATTFGSSPRRGSFKDRKDN